MNFTLHLTDRCNLTCTYCRHERRPHTMPLEVIKAAVSLSMKSGGRGTGLCFYGGEPLLCRELIYDAVAYCEGLRQSTGHPFQYRLNTNGLLLDEEFVAFAAEHRIRIGLSHDGRGQDVCRLLPDGRGSLEFLSPKVPTLLSYLPDTIVMLTVTPKTADTFADSVADLFELGFRHIYTTPAYGERVSWSEDDLDRLRSQYRRIAKLYADWSERGERFFFSTFDVKIASHIDNRRFCRDLCHIGRGQYSVTADGTLYPCTSFVGEDDFVLGDVFSGITPAAVRKMQTHKTPESCKDCALRNRCTHACGCINLIETGAVDRVSPMHCAHEQMIIEVSDALAAKLYRRRVPAFLKKHYDSPAFFKKRGKNFITE